MKLYFITLLLFINTFYSHTAELTIEGYGTDKMSPTFFALLSDEKSPEELVLYIEPLDGSVLSNSSNDGFNGLNCWLLTSST